MATLTSNYKLVLLGDSGVGKSCLVVKFTKGDYCNDNPPTLGALFMTQTVTVCDRTVKFEIWDTAGQERYKSLAPMYYRGAPAAIVAFDLTNPDSFEGAKNWILELRRRGEQGCLIALTGTKADKTEERKIDRAMAESYAQENELLYMETSAKTGLNVQQLFEAIAEKLPMAEIVKPTSVPVNAEPQKRKECCA